MDVANWLRSLGLGKYEAAFRENEIDETVMPNLTAEDLKELGVTALGHRRKLLDAIAALRNDASPQVPSTTKARGCQRAALTTTDHNIRLRYLHLAKLWHEMAREAERKANCSSSSTTRR